jgi:hypothetical protein
MSRAAAVFISVVGWAGVVAASPLIDAKKTAFDGRHDTMHAEDLVLRPGDAQPYLYLQEGFERLFRGELATATFAALSPQDRATVFTALSRMAFYMPTGHVDAMQRLHGWLARHSEATPSQGAALHAALLVARRFDEALALTRRAGLEDQGPARVLDRTVRVGGAVPTALYAAADAGVVERRAIGIDRGAWLVVLGEPACAFTQAAVEALLPDAELGPLLRKHAKWLAPAYTPLDTVAAWNAEHPGTTMGVLYAVSEWPANRLDRVPSFYFMKDGVVVDATEGWPEGGRRTEIVRGFQRIELLPASAR